MFLNNVRWIFAIVGEDFAIHLHVSNPKTEEDMRMDRPCGGVEIHSTKPFRYSDKSKPHNETCWLLNKPCWHDGSSTAAEYYTHLIRQCCNSGDWECVWNSLESDYQSYQRNRFEEE